MPFSANSFILYILAGVIIVFVIAQSVFFLLRALARARAIGMSETTLRKTIISSAIFTIAPAAAILVGVVALIPALGIPLPWLRLSILGAITYELPAASSTLDALGRSVDSPLATLTASQYVTVAWVMTLGILIGLILSIGLVKPLKRGLVNLERKDKKWSEIFTNSLFMGMIATFLGIVFKDITTGITGWIPVFVMLVSAVVMVICGVLIKKLKLKWLSDYALPISLVAGMAAAIPITAWIG